MYGLLVAHSITDAVAEQTMVQVMNMFCTHHSTCRCEGGGVATCC